MRSMAQPWHIVFALALACGGKSVEQTGATGAPDWTATDATAPPVTTPATGQKFLFEVDHENHAWVSSKGGLYVDVSGNVMYYNYYANVSPDAGALPQEGAHPTEAQIAAKYVGAQRANPVNAGTLAAMFAKVGAARRGMLVSHSHCFDYGTSTYTAWLYDDATATYTRVLLRQNGDHVIWNTAPEAHVLAEWLSGLAGADDFMCSAHRMTCAGAPCADASACSAGNVLMDPDSVRGCLWQCGPQAECETVADCTVCNAAAETCLADPLGGKHCTMPYTDCAANTCDCRGDVFCAAGKGSCGGTAETGFTCAAP
jgi:hypothetical protein